MLKDEVEFWLERGHGVFWYTEREDGFDVFLQDPGVKGAVKVTR